MRLMKLIAMAATAVVLGTGCFGSRNRQIDNLSAQNNTSAAAIAQLNADKIAIALKADRLTADLTAASAEIDRLTPIAVTASQPILVNTQTLGRLQACLSVVVSDWSREVTAQILPDGTVICQVMAPKQP